MMKNVYFIGIGGIGMSAIARYYAHKGCKVSGYDRTPSKLTAALEKEGIAIHYVDDISFIPSDIENTLVIYTPAIPKEMEELQFVFSHGYKIVKRSKALGEIASDQKCLAVSGTHGKTTTSTLLAHILTDSKEGCNAFLGGISKNYHSNLLLSKNNTLVAEADEFDRSFLQLHPQIAVITATDADHLDIYGDLNSVKEAFSEFASQVSDYLIIKNSVKIDLSKVKATVLRYSYNEPCDYYASNIRIVEGGYFLYDLNTPKGIVSDCTLGIPGWVNVENAIAASAIALLHGVKPEALKNALKNFQGVERRFDIHLNTHKCSYIDDYAHHPKEISAAISSIRNIFPGRNLCGIFQPHLFTRTRDFYKEFADSLSALDELILLPIYPAREEPIEGINSEMILERVTIDNKIIVPKEKLMDEIKSRNIDILITFGAGDIDRFITPIEEYLKSKCLEK